MIIAVTGGTGFIGKKLVERLVARGDTVRLLTRNPALASPSPSVHALKCDLVDVAVGDLSDMLDGVDVLIHCAGQLTNTQAMKTLHVDATHKLVSAASRRIGHWVQLSSVGVYGPTDQGCVTEETELNPLDDYEMTKTESDRVVIARADEGGFSYTILRPSNVFGAEMKNQSLLSMIDIIRRGLFFFIGKPGSSANYIHVSNVVEGLIRCANMDAARNKIFNLSDHRTLEQFVNEIVTVLDCAQPWLRMPEIIARVIAGTLGKVPHFPLTQTRVDALVNRSQYSISRIETELGYVHVTSMEEGLQELVGEYQRKRLCRSQNEAI